MVLGSENHLFALLHQAEQPWWQEQAARSAARASSPIAPLVPDPSLTAQQPSLQIAADCWNLLSAPDGSSRRQVYLPQGEREPQGAYERRLAAARPAGFFCEALRTYAGMLSRGSWLNLQASLASVLTDVDGRGTDLGVFLASAALLLLRDGAALVLVVRRRLDRRART